MLGCCVKFWRVKLVVWVCLYVIVLVYWGKWCNCNDVMYKFEFYVKKSVSVCWCNGLFCLVNLWLSRYCLCNFFWIVYNVFFLISCCKYKGDIVLIIIFDLNDGMIFYEVIFWDWYIICCCVLGMDENFSVEFNI